MIWSQSALIYWYLGLLNQISLKLKPSDNLKIFSLMSFDLFPLKPISKAVLTVVYWFVYTFLLTGNPAPKVNE
jgi:hypothetical protein